MMSEFGKVAELRFSFKRTTRTSKDESDDRIFDYPIHFLSRSSTPTECHRELVKFRSARLPTSGINLMRPHRERMAEEEEEEEGRDNEATTTLHNKYIILYYNNFVTTVCLITSCTNIVVIFLVLSFCIALHILRCSKNHQKICNKILPLTK